MIEDNKILGANGPDFTPPPTLPLLIIAPRERRVKRGNKRLP